MQRIMNCIVGSIHQFSLLHIPGNMQLLEAVPILGCLRES
jgi:hypothetical protein